jgi:hypothetical protein
MPDSRCRQRQTGLSGVICLQDIEVRKIFTLLSACTKNDQPLVQSVLEEMEQSIDYHILASLDQYVFLTNKGRDLEMLMKNFKIPAQMDCTQAFALVGKFTPMMDSFKQILQESSDNADISIDESYKDIHIIKREHLASSLIESRDILVKSEGFELWRDRAKYVYRNGESQKLKEEMDHFTCPTTTLGEIHVSYATLNAFRQRFEQHQDNIVTWQSVNQQRHERIREWLEKWLTICGLLALVGVAVYTIRYVGSYGVMDDEVFRYEIIGMIGLLVLYFIARLLVFILSKNYKLLEEWAGETIKVIVFIGWIVWQLVILQITTSALSVFWSFATQYLQQL